ncbi:MAG: hypothetical protein Fues2KO_02350 [Fuerstiella sp.]
MSSGRTRLAAVLVIGLICAAGVVLFSTEENDALRQIIVAVVAACLAFAIFWIFMKPVLLRLGRAWRCRYGNRNRNRNPNHHHQRGLSAGD